MSGFHTLPALRARKTRGGLGQTQQRVFYPRQSFSILPRFYSLALLENSMPLRFFQQQRQDPSPGAWHPGVQRVFHLLVIQVNLPLMV